MLHVGLFRYKRNEPSNRVHYKLSPVATNSDYIPIFVTDSTNDVPVHNIKSLPHESSVRWEPLPLPLLFSSKCIKYVTSPFVECCQNELYRKHEKYSYDYI